MLPDFQPNASAQTLFASLYVLFLTRNAYGSTPQLPAAMALRMHALISALAEEVPSAHVIPDIAPVASSIQVPET